MTVPPGSKVISYDELKAMDGTVGIDMERKESYLSREEFVVVFGVDAETFVKMDGTAGIERSRRSAGRALLKTVEKRRRRRRT